MSQNITTNKELLKEFVKNATKKIQELNGAANVLIKEGLKTELYEAIFRSTLALKSFSTTCGLNNIVAFINTALDPMFNELRINQKTLSSEQKQKIKNNITILKNMVREVEDEIPEQSSALNSTENNSANAFQQAQKRPALLAAIGQLSVWSYHDILNALTKIEGFSDMISSEVDKLGDNMAPFKQDVKNNLAKTIENTKFIITIVNQIRSLRGRTLFEPKEFNIRNLIQDIQESVNQPKKNTYWSLENIPDTTINCDQIIFSQLWTHLWRLLQEWQAKGLLFRPMIFAKISEPIKQIDDPKYNKILNLYICYENNDSGNFSPETLTYSKQTPNPDLAHVFYFATKIAEKNDIEVTCSESALKNPVFKISLPCTEPITNLKAPIAQQNKDVDLSIKKEANKNDLTGGKSVLIVDDEKDLRTILSVKINRMGYNVHTAANLQEAVQILNEKDVSLVISDLFLQDESGLELMKSLSTSRPNLPFVFITGADEDDVPTSIFTILSQYAKAFLTKPVANDVLKKTLYDVIGGANKT